jgi:DNA-binding response OmpR family regulator
MQADIRRLEVLLVEDEEAIAGMYRIRLERDGHAVRQALDGPTGLREVMDEPPDLLLLDIRLPGLDGFELLRQVRADEAVRHVPTIILSNFGSDDLLDRGRELGVLAYFVKSQTSPARLAEWIERWCAAHGDLAPR